MIVKLAVSRHILTLWTVQLLGIVGIVAIEWLLFPRPHHITLGRCILFGSLFPSVAYFVTLVMFFPRTLEPLWVFLETTRLRFSALTLSLKLCKSASASTTGDRSGFDTAVRCLERTSLWLPSTIREEAALDAIALLYQHVFNGADLRRVTLRLQSGMLQVWWRQWTHRPPSFLSFWAFLARCTVGAITFGAATITVVTTVPPLGTLLAFATSWVFVFIAMESPFVLFRWWRWSRGDRTGGMRIIRGHGFPEYPYYIFRIWISRR